MVTNAALEKMLARKQRRAVRCFVPKGRSGAVIYAVVLKNHPTLVKVGQSRRWSNRRKSYSEWDLAQGDGILDERVFTITEEFVDLLALEQEILANLPFPRKRQEWFRADLDEIARHIDRVLVDHGFSYV